MQGLETSSELDLEVESSQRDETAKFESTNHACHTYWACRVGISLQNPIVEGLKSLVNLNLFE